MPALPYLRSVKWLESDKRQFIRLPFGFDPTDELDVEFSILTWAADKYIVAPEVWNDHNNRFGMGCHRDTSSNVPTFTFAFGSTPTGNTPVTDFDNNIHCWHYGNRIVSILIEDEIKSLSVSDISFGSTTANLKLFYGYMNNIDGRLSHYKHAKNGVVVVDLIPVIDLSGRPCMYNQAPSAVPADDPSRYFYNQGTGEFTWGELEQQTITHNLGVLAPLKEEV